MKKYTVFFIAVLVLFFSLDMAMAHFGMVIPSDNMVMQDDARKIDIQVSFSHPFEMVGMPLDAPRQFFVVSNGNKTDLKSSLKNIKVMGENAFKAGYTIKRPGAYSFVMEPVPYWEPSEDCYIVHYTKTVVAAFGDDDGWDSEVGLKTEIVPLSKPFGLYAGNVFQGVVKLNGKVVPYAQVEIEFYNQDKKVTAPTDYMITQTIKADQNGVFTYSAPVAGWWGFSALSTSDEKMVYEGQPKDVELGAVIWVKFEGWQDK